ncbi:MAG: hypothetical protein ACLUD0_11800 [Eubacterium ramulus]
MHALTRRISEHQNMDQNVWKKRIKAAAIRLEGVMLLGSMAVVQMHATEGSDIFTKAKGMMNNPVCNPLQGFSSVTAGCVAAFVCSLMFFSKNRNTVEESIAWLKRIAVCWIAIMLMASIIYFVTTNLGIGDNASLY